VGNVFDAMKKHEAEQTAQGLPDRPEPAPDGPAAPPQPQPKPKRTTLNADPKVARNGYAPQLVAHYDRGGRLTEEYRELRTHLLARYEDERFCLMVTSAEKGEGKTLTCLNLAVVLAERPEYRTVAVDFDLRRGGIAALLGVSRTPGVADLLRGTVAMDDVIQSTPYPNLFVIPAGEVKMEEVGELLGRQELEEIVGRLRHDYDYVLMDTPPLNEVSDAGIVGRAVREALLVVRMHKTKREHVERAIRMLHGANVKPAGLVLTHHTDTHRGKYRYY